ncbi:MAG: hypothetical protein BJ554DRAFT_5877 [Olpidium bornovanus]|uniref:RING-type E3 ubiquitin transferase n=1 Tax=Olpidium bornovanus TaxID=278681 RepID=A0A8H8DM50_9FUNG|nr:MAG: hypothetical protein BJ554DRAFT_5877 [Olpidium bornovanus]
MVTLLNLLGFIDALLTAYAVNVYRKKGPNMMIMFGFEYTILFASVIATAVKYMLHVIDMRTEEPWEDKSIYVFYLELASDFVKLITYMVFFSLILTFYGLPLHIVRDVYLTLRSFMNKCRDLVRYRRATRNMNERYPDATEEELARMTDRTCIICREEMRRAGAPATANALAADADLARPDRPAATPLRGETPKKLPCGHIFHFHCLRSWLERQQSCPTCRRPVLQEEIPPTQPPNRPGGGAQLGRANNPPAGQRPFQLRPEHLAAQPAGVPAGFPGVAGGPPVLAAGLRPAVYFPARQPAAERQEQQRRQQDGREAGSPSAALASPATQTGQAGDGTTLAAGAGEGVPPPNPPHGPGLAGGEAQPAAPAYPPPYHPHLIPLFPLPVPGGATMIFQQQFGDAQGHAPGAVPSQPSSTTSGTEGLMSSIGSRLPPDVQLTEEQIRVLGERTRDGLVERLRMLEDIDSHIWNTMTAIVRTLSAMDAGAGAGGTTSTASGATERSATERDAESSGAAERGAESSDVAERVAELSGAATVAPEESAALPPADPLSAAGSAKAGPWTAWDTPDKEHSGISSGSTPTGTAAVDKGKGRSKDEAD